LDRAHYFVLDVRLDEAEGALREALALYETLGPSASWERAEAMHTLGWVLSAMGRADAALEVYEAAGKIELDVATRGGREVTQARAALNEAIALVEGQKFEEARARALEGLALAIAQQGPRGDMVATFHLVLAAACDELGDRDGLRSHAEQADAISQLAQGPDHPTRIDMLSAVGVAALGDGRPDLAAAAFEQALVLAQRHTTPDSIPIGLAEANLAEALHALGQDQRAISLATHALQVLEPQMPESPRLGSVLMMIAKLEFGRNDPKTACRKLEQAGKLVAESDSGTRRDIDELLARCKDAAHD
jgi:tetratricopeptide (TPR) repeat protein